MVPSPGFAAGAAWRGGWSPLSPPRLPAPQALAGAAARLGRPPTGLCPRNRAAPPGRTGSSASDCPSSRHSTPPAGLSPSGGKAAGLRDPEASARRPRGGLSKCAEAGGQRTEGAVPLTRPRGGRPPRGPGVSSPHTNLCGVGEPRGALGSVSSRVRWREEAGPG